MPYGAVDFRIMSHKMVESIVSLSEVQRFSKGIFCWVGFDTEWIPYENVERMYGTTKWSFKGLTKYAMDGILSFSVSPLKLLTIMGFTISGIAIVYAIFILIKTIVQGIDAPGYASTIIIVLLLGGIIEISIGVLGSYIARIYTEIKHRPIYIAKENTVTDNSAGKDEPTDENSAS
jgi:glycosyltransferase involved in cell wall biosynthesis